MKQAKQSSFLIKWPQHFQLFVDVEVDTSWVPSKKDFQTWIWQTCKNKYHYVNISVLLLDEQSAKTMNHDYRNKDYATNVLSFALNEGESEPLIQSTILNGDLVFCPQVIEKEAKQQHKSLKAHYAHLVVHGTLHLLGYDHITEEDAKIMEALEVTILAQLGFDNPYLEDEY